LHDVIRLCVQDVRAARVDRELRGDGIARPNLYDRDLIACRGNRDVSLVTNLGRGSSGYFELDEKSGWIRLWTVRLRDFGRMCPDSGGDYGEAT
jgi:hypothetical protein